MTSDKTVFCNVPLVQQTICYKKKERECSVTASNPEGNDSLRLSVDRTPTARQQVSPGGGVGSDWFDSIPNTSAILLVIEVVSNYN
jgi:hypothetical protein